MRACVACHLFSETGKELYAHNAYSRCFLREADRDMFRQMYDFGGKAVYALPQFLQRTHLQNPEDYAHSAWQLGHHTELGLWEFLSEDPQRMRIFSSGMRSLATVANSDVGPYPFAQELNAEPLAADEIVLVDVGGGYGQALERIKQDFPNLKGRLCLQDQQHVIQDARAKGLSIDIETQAMSFFQPNPIRGARAYYFRRIFHDWSDQPSVEILRNVAQAMSRNSRILISDTVVPDRGATRATALQDLNMMAFAGMERTEEQWQSLVQKAGLNLIRVWRKEGSMYAVVEIRLNENGNEKV